MEINASQISDRVGK